MFITKFINKLQLLIASGKNIEFAFKEVDA